MSPFRRTLIKAARTVHLYGTLSALGLILFFTVTGFMLNHEDWFGTSDPAVTVTDGQIPSSLLKEPDQLGIVESLRAEYGAVGAVSSFDAEDDQLRIVFKRPGTEVVAVVNRSDGHVEVTRQTRGITGLLLDLHRGKSTGKGWSLLIDATCILLAGISSTGLLLWWTLKGRGRWGVPVIFLGLAVIIAVFKASVP